jgi:hypothetical protein
MLLTSRRKHWWGNRPKKGCGERSNGWKARTIGCPRDLPACAFTWRRARSALAGAHWQTGQGMAGDRVAQGRGCPRRGCPTMGRPCRPTSHSTIWLTPQSCGGASNEIWSASRRSGSITTRSGWRGFHHHATLCSAAYGFLVSERETIPPQDLVSPRYSCNHLPYPTVTAPAAPPLRPERHIPKLGRHRALQAHQRARCLTLTLPMPRLTPLLSEPRMESMRQSY